MANEVKLLRGSISAYNGLDTKDKDTIYFIEDTHQIFVGDIEYVVADAMSNTAENIFTGTLDAINGTVKVAEPTTGNEAASKDYVDNALLEHTAHDAMNFKGTLGEGGTVTELPADPTNGDVYKVITAGTYAGHNCEVGDLAIALVQGETVEWVIVQANIDGAVTGPTSSVSENLVAFDGTSGKTVKDSGVATSDMSDAVDKKHEHKNEDGTDNLSVLNTYNKTQTEIETEIANATLKWESLS